MSEKTICRIIKNGRLKAVKGPSPYDQQYYLPRNEIDKALQI
ncbi:hypothetical protein [Caldicellulosiruptor morganii]|uniref:DNA-binding protein n=1 Tax=Caldicellulosiruptor morganii TaxID=1387555 RepID=A0ABY7BQU1_9FIRM|nr:hypothetical protein [Caldicellulosiruptor morganii]WAM33906.1 hypothetical protein OTK00_000046 [Caldicellulosiruptor morganii]